jgi:hypothetical protein
MKFSEFFDDMAELHETVEDDAENITVVVRPEGSTEHIEVVGLDTRDEDDEQSLVIITKP